MKNFKTVVRDELPEGMEFLEPDQMQGGKSIFRFHSKNPLFKTV